MHVDEEPYGHFVSPQNNNAVKDTGILLLYVI